MNWCVLLVLAVLCCIEKLYRSFVWLPRINIWKYIHILYILYMQRVRVMVMKTVTFFASGRFQLRHRTSHRLNGMDRQICICVLCLAVCVIVNLELGKPRGLYYWEIYEYQILCVCAMPWMGREDISCHCSSFSLTLCVSLHLNKWNF